MATTQREKLLLAVVAKLVAFQPVAVYRSRVDALAKQELPAIVVRPGGEQNEQTATKRVKRVFQILIEVHARADSTPGAEIAADQAADPVIANVHAALFQEPTFGGLAAQLYDKEMQEPQFADGDETRVGITLVYEAVYLTNDRDITTLTNH